jgi:hypothetical protein
MVRTLKEYFKEEVTPATFVFIALLPVITFVFGLLIGAIFI